MSPTEADQVDDLERLFLADVPLLDVRAPVEFAAGAFPRAENHPLIDDDERARIGTTYKHLGQAQAIELGHELVQGERRAQRIARWRAFLEQYPDAVLYCFRGGMRSRISQQWLYEETGIRCPRVRGGYKAMRGFLLDALAKNAAQCHPVVLGGRTGAGKTRVLAACRHRIDLEALAHHRGSAFGHHPQPQPSQIDFENALSIALLKRVNDGNAPFAVEDESRNIGSRHIPAAFFERMQQAPVVLLEADLDTRIEITLQEYVHDALAEFTEVYGAADGFNAWGDYLRGSLARIRRRLGGARHDEAMGLLETALAQHARQGDVEPHRAWIAFLLREYYDGMYEFQLARKIERIVFRGPRDAVVEFMRAQYGI
jgi:tRNA 2-selenouridine synthase